MRAIDELDGFKIDSKVINTLRYADNTIIVILSESEEHLLQLINVVVTEVQTKDYIGTVKCPSPRYTQIRK